jgi:hypothetical protein
MARQLEVLKDRLVGRWTKVGPEGRIELRLRTHRDVISWLEWTKLERLGLFPVQIGPRHNSRLIVLSSIRVELGLLQDRRHVITAVDALLHRKPLPNGTLPGHWCVLPVAYAEAEAGNKRRHSQQDQDLEEHHGDESVLACLKTQKQN